MSENEERDIKVTDKRMFAPDGTLREEYRFLEDEASEGGEERAAEAEQRPGGGGPAGVAGAPASAPGGGREPTILTGEGAAGTPPPGGPGGRGAEGAGPGPAPGPGSGAAPGRGVVGPGEEGGEEADWPPEDAGRGGSPRFVELVAALAEPASVYLRNAVESPGEATQSLEVARLYIDLLDVLRQKTEGNLNPQESSMLEDALGQLRLAYVQTRG